MLNWIHLAAIRMPEWILSYHSIILTFSHFRHYSPLPSLHHHHSRQAEEMWMIRLENGTVAAHSLLMGSVTIHSFSTCCLLHSFSISSVTWWGILAWFCSSQSAPTCTLQCTSSSVWSSLWTWAALLSLPPNSSWSWFLMRRPFLTNAVLHIYDFSALWLTQNLSSWLQWLMAGR